jgi:K+-sensing histidine kinase KdpD
MEKGSSSEQYLGYLNRHYKPLLILLAFVLVVLLGIIDYLTHSEISFSLFYLLPICIVTWFTGKWTGAVVSVASTLTWTVADLMVSGTYSHPVIPYWNAIARLALFLIVTYILSSLKSALEREKRLARTDYLTGVANRRSFFELTNIEIDRSQRYKVFSQISTAIYWLNSLIIAVSSCPFFSLSTPNQLYKVKS